MRAQRRRPPPSPSPGHSGSSAAIRRLPGPPMPCRFCPHLCLEFVFCSRWLVSWWSAFCLCEEAASANDCGKDYPCKMTMCVYLLFSIASRSCCCRWEKHRLALLSPQACLDFFIHGLHRSKSARGVAKEIAVKSCNALLLKVNHSVLEAVRISILVGCGVMTSHRRYSGLVSQSLLWKIVKPMKVCMGIRGSAGFYQRTYAK
ncbi:uncharacterized protein [Lolium perenne]|uniref:uncharacterized protein isoform X4 n=1 Tax=Lolium perenne TaxID=4522 RepID=UPI003A99A41D